MYLSLNMHIVTENSGVIEQAKVKWLQVQFLGFSPQSLLT